jgi:hypothetical protein
VCGEPPSAPGHHSALDFADFLRGYMETAEHDAGDDWDAVLADWSPAARAQAEAECRAFVDANAADLATCARHFPNHPLGIDTATPAAVLGYLFWLTRTGAGIGFWTHALDGEGETEEAFARLSAAAEAAGRRWIGVGDDGLLYLSA